MVTSFKFLQNKYTRWYFNIVSNAMGRFGYKMSAEEIAQRTATMRKNKLLKKLEQGEIKFLA